MTHEHPEAADYSAHQAELEQLAGNEKECEDCGGSGRVMTMVCYGEPPHETEVDCEACRGRGVVRS